MSDVNVGKGDGQTITLKEFKDAVKTSQSIREVLRYFGKSYSGGQYRWFHMVKTVHDVDTSHFTGKGHLKGKTHNFTKGIPLEEILVEKSTYIYGANLKRRLCKAGVKHFDKCDECGQTDQWNGKPLVLQLDHINGIPSDNRIENIRCLCPNCHAQTPTYGRKNTLDHDLPTRVPPPEKKRKSDPKKKIVPTTAPCEVCQKPVKTARNQTCSKSCALVLRSRLNPKIDWDKYDLMEELKTKSYSALAREIGCSDNAIRKRLRRMRNNE